MPQQKQEKVVNTFVKGLITEAGELTFPPDASVDELNCDLRRDGSRRRRKGIEYEAGNSLSSFTVTTTDEFSTGEWINVGGQNGLNFLVVQNGDTLYFYNKSSRPYSTGEIAESVDLSPYATATGGGAGFSKCSFTSIKGALVVASPSIETIYVTRNNVTGVLTVSQISFRVRDFKWLSPLSEFGDEKASPSDERKYDTYNAGWFGNGAAALTTYLAARSNKYPPLTHPWYSGKNSSGTFSVSEFITVGAGTSITGNGGFILDFFNKDRATASGIAGLPSEVELSRFSTVTSFAGRVFYAGINSDKNSGSILFSGLITDLNDLGECLQKNDPTSEFLSDLLDTDGGVINILDAVGIKKLHAFGNSLLVFASNGVWQISGVDDVFRATGYAVNKISEIGLQSPNSFVSVEGIPFWWSTFGIHTLSFDQVSGQAREENISIGTIQKYWDELGLDSKEAVVATFDKINKRVFWFWPDTGFVNEKKRNNALVLDINLQAFYPWRVEDFGATTSYIIGAEFYSGYGVEALQDIVVVSGDPVEVNTDQVIVDSQTSFATGDTALVVLTVDGSTGKLTMSGFTNEDFLDWAGESFLSFAEAGYDFMDSIELRKTLPYLTVFCRRTEDGWVGDSSSGYDLDNQSSLLVSSYWDFKSTPSTSPQQAYRLKTFPVVNPAVFDYPTSVITTRLKLRGRGRSLKLRFESEEGKDFILLGYGMIEGRNATF